MNEEKSSNEITNATPLVLSKSSANIKTQQNPTEGKKCLKQPCSTKVTMISALLAILLIGICTGVGVYLFNENSNGAKNGQEKTSVTTTSTTTTTTSTTTTTTSTTTTTTTTATETTTTTTIQTKGTCKHIN